MDVVWGETAGVDGQLWLLCPILFIMQVIRKHFDICLERLIEIKKIVRKIS